MFSSKTNSAITMETADVVIIGSGQGGVPLAADFAKEGRKVDRKSVV